MSSSPAVGAPIDPMALPDARKFLIFGVMAFGQFMALIDIQIVAASLNEVQACSPWRAHCAVWPGASNR
jgi:DHA2 family multidrug resistance protein